MKWKAVIGIVLAVASLAALYLWETKFEDEVTLTSVIVLSEDHVAGDSISISDLKVMKINPQAKLENALTEKDAAFLEEKILNISLAKNQQLKSEYFISKEDVLPEGYVNFVIPSEWIYSKSILINQRDETKIFAMPDKVYLGTYKIDQLYDGTIEVIAQLEDYFKIYDAINKPVDENSKKDVKNKLLFVMEEDL